MHVPTRRFVITVDDPGGLIQDLGIFRKAQDFFEAEGVPATFFVVPRGKDGWQLDGQKDWLEALHRAEARGHDCQLHGLDHSHCEFGPYPPFLYAMGGQDPAPRLKADTEKLGHLWKRELFVEKLRTALSIFENALGRKPLAFRSGALAQCSALYEALADVGIRYSSNHVTDPRGWAYIAGRYENPGDWAADVPPAPYKLTPRIVSLPMISEFAWRLTPEKVEKHLALALEDLRRVYEANGVFVLICHVQEVGAETPLPRQLLHRLLDAARKDYQVKFMTLKELVAAVERGEVPVISPR